MYPSIRVSEFIQPERGSSAFNAVSRALEIKPDVRLIGSFKDERYYRVKGDKGQPHCVILSIDIQDEPIVTCNCMAHHRPQSPLACYHVGAVLLLQGTGMSEEEEDEPIRIPCCRRGQLTTWDPIYNDLCYRCIRADNE